jgi:hypothetical protein
MSQIISLIDATGQQYNIEFHQNSNNGTLIPVSILRDQDGQIVNVASVEKQNDILGQLNSIRETASNSLLELAKLNQEPSSLDFHSVSFVVIPTTLTTGLNYFVLRNPSTTKKIKIRRIVADAFFAGTAAASRSTYALKKFAGVTATTGNTIPVAKRDSLSPNTIADVKTLPTGLALTGAIDHNNISHISHPNQLSTTICKDWTFENPIVLNTNDAIALQSEGAIVAGSSVVLTIQFYEI